MTSTRGSNRPPAVSRRDLLKKVVTIPPAAFLAGSLGDHAAVAQGSGIQTPRTGAVAGIDPTDLVGQYAARRLDALSDAELYGQVAAIVSRPLERLTSFTLHAPLELMARYGLLPLVEPRERRLARLQMVASGSVYASAAGSVDLPPALPAFLNLSAARRELTRTFTSADADRLDAVVLRIASQFGASSVVHLLTPLALPTLTGAAHSHIGLWLLLRHGMAGEVRDATLLRAAVRRLAAQPNLRLASFSGMEVVGTRSLERAPEQIEQDVFDKLRNPPRGSASSTSMRVLLEAGERTRNPDTLFGDLVRHDLTNEQIDAAFRAVLRVCAHSMLQDELSRAKFGWSHCLTLPQAACGLSDFNIDRKLALAATLVWTTAYRSVLSQRTLDFEWAPERPPRPVSLTEALQTSPALAAARAWHAGPEELQALMRTLATEASIRNDQHLVKYTRACLDMGSFDPSHKHLYLAAAAHLCAVWVREAPRDQIEGNLRTGRTVP